MDSAHAEAAVLLITAGADRDRVGPVQSLLTHANVLINPIEA